jgi:D-arabinose 1-dehydrogenase-like Zn-dependent alcohol dehydrogenase
LTGDDNILLFERTAGRQISMTMREVMKNQQLIGTTHLPVSVDPFSKPCFSTGSTMGSYADLIAATDFLSEHRIVPTVSHVLEGLENAEEGFKIMKKGNGFGKIVIKIGNENTAKL